MESLQVSLRDHSYTSVTLLVLALATVLYLSHLRSKALSTWLLTGAYASFALAALAMFLTTSVVYWGYALWPAQYALALVGLAALVQFAYRFPESDQPSKARLCLYVSAVVIALSLVFTGYTAYEFLAHQRLNTGLEALFPLILPAGALASMGIFLKRIIHFTPSRAPANAGMGSRLASTALAILRPQTRHSVTLRNFSIGHLLAFGAGLAYPLSDAGYLPSSLATYVVSIGLLTGLAWLVLAYLGYGSEPTSFIVKLVLVSLVINLVVFEVLGLYASQSFDQDYMSEKRWEAATVRKTLQMHDLPDLPGTVAYVAACPVLCPGGCFVCGAQAVYLGPGMLTRGAGNPDAGEAGFVVTEDRLSRLDASALVPFDDTDTLKLATYVASPVDHIAMRYASNPVGTLYQYMGFQFTVSDVVYEVGFPLSEYRQFVHTRILALICLVMLSCLAILIVFPLFLRTNLVRPLQALLEGVRQVNSGNLEVAVPMQMGDEIGFLAYSFTGMVGSIRALNSNLRQEINERQRAEAGIRALAATLEQRVAEQTRGLSALFNVSASASQALTLETLMVRSLEQTMAAVRSTAGLIYVRDVVTGRPRSPWLQLVAHRGIPSRLVGRLARLPEGEGLAGWVVEAKEPLLVPDLSQDPRTPDAVRARLVRSGILAPLRAGGQVMGVFALLRRREEPFDQEEVSLLASIADQVGLAVEGYRLRQMAEQTAVLKERQRLARDLHDSITQDLYSLNLLAEAGQAQLETGALSAAGNTFEQIGRSVRQALKEIRLFIQQLRPPALEQVGLVGALHQRLASVEGRANVQTRLLVDEAMVLPAQVEDALYHIASEALNNTLKHADADTVTVLMRLERDDAVMEVVDNGRGFDPAAVDGSGMGMQSMRERANQVGGSVQVVSTPGTGTMVRVIMPMVPQCPDK